MRARELAVARKFRESRALVNRAEPRSAEELSLAASVLVELRDPQAALPLARRAVELAPDGWRGHVAVADATRQLWWRRESVAAARRAVELAPEEAAAHRALAAAANRIVGGGPEARQAAKRAKELGGRGALRMPGRRSQWWFLMLVPTLVSLVLLAVRDWPDAVENVLDVSRVLPLALFQLLFILPSRAGLTWRERIAEIRALNEERYGGGGRAARTRAGLAAMPWGCAVAVGAALLEEPARTGDPLPASVVVPAVLIGGVVPAILARRTVRLWYGERFLREVFVPSAFVRVHLVAAGVLGGGVVLLTLGDASQGSWQVLLVGTVVWFLLSLLSPLRHDPEASEKEAVDV